jgi:hypothetical protein
MIDFIKSPAGAPAGPATVPFDPGAGRLARLREELIRLDEEYEEIVEAAVANAERQEALKAQIEKLEKPRN